MFIRRKVNGYRHVKPYQYSGATSRNFIFGVCRSEEVTNDIDGSYENQLCLEETETDLDR